MGWFLKQSLIFDFLQLQIVGLLAVAWQLATWQLLSAFSGGVAGGGEFNP